MDVWVLDSTENEEISIIEEACADIQASKSLRSDIRDKLLTHFKKRFENAESLVQKESVRKLVFEPSGRVIWTIRGRSGEYQVIPRSNFCNCDDYYFRVIGKKRQLCYHLIAQKLAESLSQFRSQNLPDSRYSAVTKKWRDDRLRK